MNGSECRFRYQCCTVFLSRAIDWIITLSHILYLYHTEIELLSYPLLHTEEEIDIHEFLKDVTVVDLNQAIKEAAIKLRR